MKIKTTKIKDLILIEPDIFQDERGLFLETYHQLKYKKLGIPASFKQDNLSVSKKGVLRGLHLQLEPWAQGKLVQVARGKVLDVAVDARPDSSTLGEWVMVELNAEKRNQFFIPEGFLHGFVALEDETILTYKCTNFYQAEAEVCVRWDDPDLQIDWRLSQYNLQPPLVSAKDKQGISWRELIKILRSKNPG